MKLWNDFDKDHLPGNLIRKKRLLILTASVERELEYSIDNAGLAIEPNLNFIPFIQQT